MVYYSLARYNRDMFLVGILSWWYGAGWRRRVQIIKGRLLATSDYFSIGLLLSTLFSPFRQISAGSVRGPLGLQMRAFFDRTISRLIGSIVRLGLMLFGSLFIVIQTIFSILILIAWFVVPSLPVIGLIMAIIGWVPLWI